MTSQARSSTHRAMPCRPSRWFAGVLVVTALGGLGGCAAFQARKSFSTAERLSRDGDLDAALAEYESAARGAPGNAKYQEALIEARRKAAARHAEAAGEAERGGRWKEALAAWEKAAEVNPTDPSLKARGELARLHTRRSEPIEFWEATQRLAAALPGDAAIQKALARRREDALRYYVKLAGTYADAGAAAEAFLAYEKARKVDPKNEVFDSPMYRMSKAKHLEAEGDAKAEAGDTVAAFRLYEASAALARLPGIDRKLQKAKRVAGSTIEQIEQARGYEKLKQWEDAAELYTVILERGDAPADVKAAARIARSESASLRAGRALELAKKGQAAQAQASLELALEHVDGEAEGVAGVRAGLELLRKGDPSAARPAFAAAKEKAPDLVVHAAAEATVLASAQVRYQEALARAKDDPAGAMVVLAKLGAFEKELKGYDATRKALLKKAFVTLLEQAEARAESGSDEASAELFATALELANPPAKIKAPLDAGATALRTGDYATADAVFDKILEKDSKSRLAQTGKRIAARRRLARLVKEAEEAEAVGDAIRAAAAYRGILEVAPDDAAARAGLDRLRDALITQSVAAADGHKAAGRAGAAFVYYRRALDLDPANELANRGLTEIRGQFDTRRTALAFVAPMLRGGGLGAGCPKIESDLRERLILYLTRSRDLGAEFLQRAGTQEVDDGARPAPTVALRGSVDACEVGPSAGRVAASYELTVGGQSLYKGTATGAFDPSSVPKDELEGGLSPEKVAGGALNEVARQVAKAVRDRATSLADWRGLAAQALVRANDADGAARMYATLRLDEDKLTDAERAALRDLARFIQNTYR